MCLRVGASLNPTNDWTLTATPAKYPLLPCRNPACSLPAALSLPGGRSRRLQGRMSSQHAARSRPDRLGARQLCGCAARARATAGTQHGRPRTPCRSDTRHLQRGSRRTPGAELQCGGAQHTNVCGGSQGKQHRVGSACWRNAPTWQHQKQHSAHDRGAWAAVRLEHALECHPCARMTGRVCVGGGVKP